MCKGYINNVEEIEKALPAQIRTVRAYNIPSKKRIGIVKITTRHSSQSKEMLRKESQIYSHKEKEEMTNPMVFWILAPCQFRYPEVESREDPENGSHRLYIMEVSNNVVSHILFQP